MLRFAGLFGVASATLKLFGFLIFLEFARVMSVAEYAKFGVLYAVQAGLGAFAVAGITEATVGARKGSSKGADAYGLALSVFFILVVSCSLFLLSALYFAKQLEFVPIGWMGIVLVVGGGLAFASLQAQFLVLDEKHTLSLYFSFLVPFVCFLAGGIAFFLYKTVLAYFFGAGIGIFSILVVLRVLSVGNYSLALRVSEVRALLFQVTPYIVLAFLGWLVGYGNNYIIGYFFGAQEIATFTFLLSLSGAMQILGTSVNQVWSARSYRLLDSVSFDSVESRGRRVYLLLGVFMGLAAALALMSYRPILGVLGGNLSAYANRHWELLLMFCSYICLIPWWHLYGYFVYYGKGRLLFRASFLAGIAGLLVGVVMMAIFGEIGIYMGFLSQVLIRSFIIAAAARKNWPVTVAWEGVVAGCFVATIGSLIV